jgi:hypothetical protein
LEYKAQDQANNIVITTNHHTTDILLTIFIKKIAIREGIQRQHTKQSMVTHHKTIIQVKKIGTQKLKKQSTKHRKLYKV